MSGSASGEGARRDSSAPGRGVVAWVGGGRVGRVDSSATGAPPGGVGVVGEEEPGDAGSTGECRPHVARGAEFVENSETVVLGQ